MSSSNTATVLCPPSFPTVLLVPEQLRSDEVAQEQLSCLLEFLSSEKRYDDFEEGINEICQQYAASASSDERQLLLHAWERVKKQLKVEVELHRFNDTDLDNIKLLAEKSKSKTRPVYDAIKDMDDALMSVARSLTELRDDLLIYKIWARLAGIDDAKCKRLVNVVMDVFVDRDALQSVDSRTFVKDLLKDGQAFGPRVTGDAAVVRAALESEVKKYDLKPRSDDKVVLQRSEGYFYAFESLVNDRKWFLSQSDRLGRPGNGNDPKLNYVFEEPLNPSFPTSLLDSDAKTNSKDVEQHSVIVSETRRRLLVMRFERYRVGHAGALVKSLDVLSTTSIERIGGHCESLSAKSKDKVELPREAWERVKKQIETESLFIELERKLAEYSSGDLATRSTNVLYQLKTHFKEKVERIGEYIKELREDSKLFTIWVQKSSIDTVAECKQLIDATLKEHEHELKRYKPLDFIRYVLQEEKVFGPSSTGLALSVRRILLAEVERDPSPTQGRDGIFHAFESFLNDRKWICLQEDRLSRLITRTDESEVFLTDEGKRRKAKSAGKSGSKESSGARGARQKKRNAGEAHEATPKNKKAATDAVA